MYIYIYSCPLKWEYTLPKVRPPQTLPNRRQIIFQTQLFRCSCWKIRGVLDPQVVSTYYNHIYIYHDAYQEMNKTITYPIPRFRRYWDPWSICGKHPKDQIQKLSQFAWDLLSLDTVAPSFVKLWWMLMVWQGEVFAQGMFIFFVVPTHGFPRSQRRRNHAQGRIVRFVRT